MEQFAGNYLGIVQRNKVAGVDHNDLGLRDQSASSARKHLRYGAVARSLKNECRNRELRQHGGDGCQNIRGISKAQYQHKTPSSEGTEKGSVKVIDYVGYLRPPRFHRVAHRD